ncbi:signal peptidase II [Candidatus Izimaplasma bacterium ZiA1]|uniref:signal peptidase II n=1 Tax=Candidatus Izimoplasma sp. ZiA1 TaxID=2024899 RepID=UPI000BAA5AFE|nr:signal peptidase II [Candidatus Izimaplasma bacterium ZiA1]
MNKKTIIYSLVTIVILIVIDQLTKYLIVRTMDEGQSIEVIKDFFYISSHRNSGALWGIMQQQMVTFYLVTIAALGFFYYLLKDADFTNKKFYSISIILLIAGGIGNFIDRLIFKEVVDFLNFYIFGFDFAIFNFADMCLTVGVAMFAIDVLILDGKRKKSLSN